MIYDYLVETTLLVEITISSKLGTSIVNSYIGHVLKVEMQVRSCSSANAPKFLYELYFSTNRMQYGGAKCHFLKKLLNIFFKWFPRFHGMFSHDIIDQHHIKY